jgi:hypothetical protein
MNQEFLNFVESELNERGAIQLSDAINTFPQFGPANNRLMDSVAGFLNGTGKYVVARGVISQNLMIERNPNYETGKSVVETNKSVKETNSSIQTLNTATLNNYKTQRNLTVANIFVAISAVIISTIALFKGDSQEVAQLRTEVIPRLRLIDSLVHYQKGIDSSLKIYLEHLPQDTSNR